jgi:HNH endonuclease
MIDPFCKAPECNRASACVGYCIMHYKRWKRNGSPERVLRQYTNDARCEFCNKLAVLRKGLCKACAIRKMRKGYVERDIALRGSGTINTAGYRLVTRFGVREYEHRIIAKAKIGQVVHHKDNNTSNNHPDNLEVCSSQSEHMQKHRRKA